MSSQNTGRHRAPSPLSSKSSLSSAISRSARPASKASAVIVISGAMVASLALPATAAPVTTNVKAAAPIAQAAAVAIPVAAQAPLAPETFGNIGFTGVVKPRPRPVKPKISPRTIAAVSRSMTRSVISTPTQKAPAASQAPAASGVLGIAASLAGIYYIYGGTTTAGFDCSGYTLPRTAEDQRQAVTAVSNPQPGDLVFFGSPAYHVGIYAGNGTMWDSPHTGAAIAKRAIWSSTATFGRP